jgi:hypothetical protein
MVAELLRVYRRCGGVDRKRPGRRRHRPVNLTVNTRRNTSTGRRLLDRGGHCLTRHRIDSNLCGRQHHDPASADNSGWNTTGYPAATSGNKLRAFASISARSADGTRGPLGSTRQ